MGLFKSARARPDFYRLRLVDGSSLNAQWLGRLHPLWEGVPLALYPLAAQLSYGDVGNTIANFFWAAFGVALSRAHLLGRFQLTFNNHASLCFNTRPDKETLPTSPENLLAARSVRGNSLFWGFNTSVLLFLACREPYFATSGFALAALAGQIGNSVRLGKVSKGQWVIEDVPPPEAVMEIGEPVPVVA